MYMCRYKIIHLQVPICMWFANLWLVVMQSRESLLHGCAILGHSELLKELVTQHHLNINQPNLVRTHCHYCTYVYYALWVCIQLFLELSSSTLSISDSYSLLKSVPLWVGSWFWVAWFCLKHNECSCAQLALSYNFAAHSEHCHYILDELWLL